MVINEIATLSEENICNEKMLYARRIGPYGEENYSLMSKFKEWASMHNLMEEDAILLGIAQDNPSVTLPNECRYDVCLLSEYDPAEEWIQKGLFQGGKYIVLRIPHTKEAVFLAWQEGVAYIMKQGYVLDVSRPFIERYVKQLVDGGECEFMIPIM